MLKTMAQMGMIISLPSVASTLTLNMGWSDDSSPDIMTHYYNSRFSELPKSGKVSETTKYWSGDYWSLKKGNINFRWFAKKKSGYSYHSPTFEEARKMRIPELAQLSPSEKYDLYTGSYDYPLKEEVNKVANPHALYWEGICHGWAPASVNHVEPTPKLVKNPDGIEIPFGSTDIKALLSYYYAYEHTPTDTGQMGKRCFAAPKRNKRKECHDDLNAGAFHIVLANKIGIEGKGIIADLERFNEVWNHPIVSYDSKILWKNAPRKDSAPKTLMTMSIQTTIEYVDENGHDWHPVIGSSKQITDKLIYQYELDIDDEGKIIGGRWESWKRPDFLWLVNKPRKFQGRLSRLSDLL